MLEVDDSRITGTQASAAIPCSLTVGTPPDEAVPGSIEGKLICGGQGVYPATIKFSGLPGGSESVPTRNDGSYELGVLPPFSPGQSYTVSAKYDGDINLHLQPASATTIINIPGSTGSTPQNSNAGSTQDTGNAGSTQDTGNAGSTQDTGNAGIHRTLAMLEVHRTLAMLEIQQDNSTAVSQRTQPFIF